MIGIEYISKKGWMKNMNNVAFITLGCKVNQYETNAMIQQFKNKGYNIVEHNEKAEIYVINTCTVTNMSDRKSRQMIRRMKEQNKDAIIVACGCYVQVAQKEIENIEEIDIAIGNNEKSRIVEIVEEYKKKHFETTKPKNSFTEISQEENLNILTKVGNVIAEDVMQQKEFVDLGDVTYTSKTRATIKIQDGCDRFCSYCIIPYARGRVRSRKLDKIIEEAQDIAKEGIKEIVITGIHIASYGKDFKNEYKLIDLLEELNKINGIERIRLGSIEPLLITEQFVERLKKLDKICHHFHLSLQSGCDETLKRMNRRYTTEQFRNIVNILRKNYEDVILTTDIIVGFPQETEKEFETTYQFLKEIKFYKMHIFKYSQRKGTKAAQMEGQIDGSIKEKRSQELIALSDENEETYNKQYINKTVEVLWEEEKNGHYQGHTKNYILAYTSNNLSADKKEGIENKITKAICKEAKKDHIVVEI